MRACVLFTCQVEEKMVWGSWLDPMPFSLFPVWQSVHHRFWSILQSPDSVGDGGEGYPHMKTSKGIVEWNMWIGKNVER